MSYPSFRTNASTDFLPEVNPQMAEFYAPDTAKRNQYASPIWAANLTALPPLLFQIGEKERLRDEGVAFAKKVSNDPKAVVELEVYEVLLN